MVINLTANEIDAQKRAATEPFIARFWYDQPDWTQEHTDGDATIDYDERGCVLWADGGEEAQIRMPPQTDVPRRFETKTVIWFQLDDDLSDYTDDAAIGILRGDNPMNRGAGIDIAQNEFFVRDDRVNTGATSPPNYQSIRLEIDTFDGTTDFRLESHSIGTIEKTVENNPNFGPGRQEIALGHVAPDDGEDRNRVFIQYAAFMIGKHHDA